MDGTHGVQIDPVTGRPMVEEEARRRKEAFAKDKEQLRRQADFANISTSKAAVLLRELVWHQLYERINGLLETDPGVVAYVHVLRELNERSDLAARAADKLTRLGEEV